MRFVRCKPRNRPEYGMLIPERCERCDVLYWDENPGHYLVDRYYEVPDREIPVGHQCVDRRRPVNV